jgi:hypothetical protein
VQLANELFELYQDETIRISCDDKIKIPTGIPAVSRYSSIQKFFMIENSPNYRDHDFPFEKSKIIPSGYLVLKSGVCRRRSASHSPKRCKVSGVKQRSKSCHASSHDKPVFSNVRQDKLGRSHIVYGRTGKSHIVNRAQRFHQSSAEEHAHDLQSILEEEVKKHGKKSVLLVTDNGPDWSPKSLHTYIALGRLWRNLKLEVLVQTTFAAGDSQQNFIEHLWSPVNRWLVGVVLPNSAPGERPPDLITGLNDETRRAKNAEVFDKAIKELNGYIQGHKWDGYEVIPHPVSCLSEGQQKNHAKIERFLSAPIRDIQSNEDYEVSLNINITMYMYV